MNILHTLLPTMLLTQVQAKNSRFDIALLNKNDTLFDKNGCLLFLYALTSVDTQVRTNGLCFLIHIKIHFYLTLKEFHQSSKFGTYSMDRPDVSKPSVYGFPEFSCLIGITYLEQVYLPSIT